MKKTIVLGLLSMGALTYCAQQSNAGLFQWWHRHHGRYSTTIHVRQYNAFTPICSGRLFCDGCVPPPLCGHPRPMPFYPPMFGPHMDSCHHVPHGPPSFCTTGCCDMNCLPAPGALAEQPQPSLSPVPGLPPTPPKNDNGYTPPAPTPLPTMSHYPMPSNMHQVGYHSSGYQVPYPAPMANPYMMPVNYYPNYGYGYPPQGYGYGQTGYGYPQPNHYGY